MTETVDRLMETGNLPEQELIELLRYRNPETTEYLFQHAVEARRRHYGEKVLIWGRVSLSSYCKFDCKYCGIRRSNRFASRYQMPEREILEYCGEAYRHGIRHFLLEGGVDPAYAEEDIAHILLMLRRKYQDAEIILSLGERTEKAYRQWLHAGAGAYLMPQDTIEEGLFRKIHPSNMTVLKRKQHMWQLREQGYQVGAGYLIGCPYQTIEQVAADILFIKQYAAQLVIVVPFIPAWHTPFEQERGGNGEMVLYNMAILRLMLPSSTIIADPSLEQAIPDGRQRALSAGANVLITDLAPEEIQEQYQVYNRRPGRRNMDDRLLASQIRALGYSVGLGRE